MGCKGKGTSPKWAGAPSPKGPCALGFGGNPKGGAPLAWGASPLPLGRRPPSGSHLEGAGPPCPSPINRRGEGRAAHTIQGAAPPLPNTSPPPYVLGEALSEYCSTNCTTPSCCRWSLLPQPLLPHAGSRRRRRRSSRTCVERGGAVRSALGHR